VNTQSVLSIALGAMLYIEFDGSPCGLPGAWIPTSRRDALFATLPHW